MSANGVAAPTSVDPTGLDDIDGILWGFRWTPTALTYSFPTASTEYITDGYESVTNFGAFSSTGVGSSPSQQAAATRALNQVASFTNLTFTLTTAADANLRFAMADQIDSISAMSRPQGSGSAQ